MRGRDGSRLARPPQAINVGEVLRATEDSLALVECFEKGTSDCRIAPCCVLKQALEKALQAFLAVLDSYTLADLIAPSSQPLTRILSLRMPAAPRQRASLKA